VPFFRTGSLLQSDAIADFMDRHVEGLDWLLGTVGTPAPELVEPPCAQICSHEPRESPRQSRPGLGEMTNEDVGGSIRYGVGIDAEEHVIGSFDPLHLAGSTDCLQRLMHQCALFRR
jgi:hypothetical protein